MSEGARGPSAGLMAMSAFFLIGTVMSGLTAVALFFPGGALEPMWRLNSEAHSSFLPLGAWAVALMASVCAACAFAAVGLWRRTRWGRALAVTILAVNLIGDGVSAVVRRDPRTLIGLPIAAAMIAYLSSARVGRELAGMTTNDR